MSKEIANEVREGQNKLLTDSSQAFGDAHDDGKGAEAAHRKHMDQLAESLKKYGILPQLAIEDRLHDEKLVLKGQVAEQKVEACKKNEDTKDANVYEVKKGDTMWGISRDHLRETAGKEPSQQEVKAHANAIARQNGLTNPERIYPGQKLKITEVKDHKKDDAPDKKPQPAEKNPVVAKPAPVKDIVAAAKQHRQEKKADSGLDFVREQFDKIDQDSDHHVSGREIDHYMNDNKDSLSEKQVSALKKVSAHAETLQKQSNDENGRENGGMTRQDIDVAEKRMRAIEYAQEHFEPMDGDGNGHVSKKEIRGYMRANDDRLSQQDRANCQLLMEECGDLDDKCDDEMFFEWGGFSKKDLSAAQEELGAKTLKGDDRLPLPKQSEEVSQESFDPVTMQEFSKESLRLFDKIDSDADGNLNARELRAAAQSDNYQGRDKQLVSALYKSRSEIAEINDDDFLMPDSTITRGDLEKMEVQRSENIKQAKNVKNAKEYLAQQDNFMRLDTDANSYLSKQEVCNALQSNSLSKGERESLGYLRDHMDEVSEASNDERGPEFSGISQMDLEAFGNTELCAIEQNLRNAYELQKQSIKNGKGVNSKTREANRSGKEVNSGESQRKASAETQSNEKDLLHKIGSFLAGITGTGAAQAGMEAVSNS